MADWDKRLNHVIASNLCSVFLRKNDDEAQRVLLRNFQAIIQNRTSMSELFFIIKTKKIPSKNSEFYSKDKYPPIKRIQLHVKGYKYFGHICCLCVFFDRESFRRILKRLHGRNLHLAGDNGVGKTWLAKTIGAAQPDETEKNVLFDKLPNYCGWNCSTMFSLFLLGSSQISIFIYSVIKLSQLDLINSNVNIPFYTPENSSEFKKRFFTTALLGAF